MFNILIGSKEVMEEYAKSGVSALNPKTMKFQIINKEAKYKVIDDGIGATLTSDIDLITEAKEKGLIL